MTSKRTGAKTLALLACGALALTACSTANSGGGSSSSSSSGSASGPKNATITVAHEQEFNAYNNNTAEDNAVQNTIVLNQVLRGFWAFGKDGSVQPDTEFGTYEKTSDSPLTVKYTIDPKATWSDGTKVDCVDMMLVWAANSGYYKTGKKNADGSPGLLFSTAGTTGYDLMNKPTCNAGDQTVTITYQKPFADWAAMFGDGAILPAHVLEKQSGVSDLISAIKNDDTAQLTKAAAFYNSGWKAKPGTIDPALMPSDGPYGLSSWQAGQSLTLTANDKWWGDPAKVKNITVRFVSQDAQGQALANGDIQVAEPQPNTDVLNQLKAVGSKVTVLQGDEYTFEHLDPNFAGEMKDANVRKAFALCAPRQQIVDNLIKPVNGKAVVMNSVYKFPFNTDYDTVVKGSYDGTYDKPDIAQAKKLLAAAGKTGIKVRIGYQTPNPRRSNEVALIRSSCNQAGFNIQDAGQADFFGNGLAAGNFDVALFAWSGSPIVTSNSSTYVTGGGNNNGKYSNKTVDSLVSQLNITTDKDTQTQLITKIQKQLWDDLASIPLFAFPGLAAYDNTVSGVVFQPSQTQITWNMQQWDLQSAS